MKSLLFALSMVFASIPAFAQERGTPAPAARLDAPVAAEQEAKPGVTRITGPCFREGDMLTIEGNRLDALKDRAPAVRVDGGVLMLELLSRTDERFTVRIPLDDRLMGGREYELLLANPANPLEHDATPLALRLCPGFAMRPERGGRDILIYAEARDRVRIEQGLGSARIVEATDLPGLGGVLLIIDPGREGQRLLEDLRARFPDATIDWNDDLSAARGPRLFAGEAIGWPKEPGCLPVASSLRIGLIDGRIERSHEAFKGQTLTERVFMDAEPDREHATAIASLLIGSAPEEGFDGFLKGAPLFSAVVLRRTDKNEMLAATSAVVRALDWLMAEKVRLINVSLTTDTGNRVMERAFEMALDGGAIVFAAAGNNGPRATPVFPASIERVIAVTAVDAAGRIYKQANLGSYLDFAAPGVDLWTASPDGGGAYRTGTSYAAPLALAVAAQHMRANPSMSRDVLLKSLSERAISTTPADREANSGGDLLRTTICEGR